MAYPRVAGHEWDRTDLFSWSSAYAGKFFGLDTDSQGGGVAPAITTHHDTTGRLSAKCTVVAQNQTSEILIPIWHLRPSQTYAAAQEVFGNSDGGQWHEFDIYIDATIASHTLCVWRVMDDNTPTKTELARLTITAGKLGTLVDGNQEDEATASIISDTHYTISVYYKAATAVAATGDFRVWLDGVEISTIRQQHSENGDWTQLRLGVIKVNITAGNVNVYYNWHELVDEATYTEFSDFIVGSLRFRDRGLGQLRDIDERWAKVYVQWNPGVYKQTWDAADDVQYRFYGHAGTVWSASSAEAYGSLYNLTNINNFSKVGNITGLSPNTAYVFKIRTFRQGSEASDYYESPHTLSFTTRQTTTKQSRLIGVGSGQNHGQYLKHWRYYKDRGCDEIWWAGNLFYNDTITGVDNASDETPCANTEDLLRAYSRLIYDRFFADCCRTIPLICQADNHDYADESYQADYRQGYIDSIMNPSGNNGEKYDDVAELSTDPTLNSNSVKIQTMYDENRVAYKKTWGEGHTQSPRGGTGSFNKETFRVFEHCNTLFALMDTRTFNDAAADEPTSGGVNTKLGVGQLAYFRSKFQGTQKPIVVILSCAAWSDLCVGNDNWKNV